MIGKMFDGEFQTVPIGQTGKRKRPLLLPPLRRINRNLRRLTGREVKPLGLFQHIAINVMGDRFNGDDFDGVGDGEAPLSNSVLWRERAGGGIVPNAS